MIKKCSNCENFIKERHSKKFCSRKCQQDFQYKEYIDRWKVGMESGSRGYQVSKHIRRYLFEKYNSSCSICGWNKVNITTGKIPLEIEHIDGHFDNNIENNLTLLCPNCHSLTSTYKSLNKGNGRKARIKYKPQT